MNRETPRPYYVPNVLHEKRKAEQAALTAALKSLLGFGTCKVVRPSDAAMDAARQSKRNDH